MARLDTPFGHIVLGEQGVARLAGTRSGAGVSTSSADSPPGGSGPHKEDT